MPKLSRSRAIIVLKIKILQSMASLIVFGLLAGCATNLPPGAISRDQYEDLILSKVQHTQKYSGFYNDYDVNALLMTPDTVMAQQQFLQGIYQWSDEKKQEELEKVEESFAKETEVIISFYAPEKKHDDLSRNKTLWKIYLDVAGQRYEGKATKLKLLRSEVQGLYPFHTRFGSPYMVTFPYPAKQLTGQSAKVTITGPIGTMEFKFE